MILNTMVITDTYVIFNFESEDTIKGEIPKRKSEKVNIGESVNLSYTKDSSNYLEAGVLKSIKNYTDINGIIKNILIIDTGINSAKLVEIDANSVTDATVIHLRDDKRVFDEQIIYVSDNVKNYRMGETFLSEYSSFIVGVNAFATVGEAIKAANENATIYIRSGKYTEEEDINIDKSISIYGNNKFGSVIIEGKLIVNNVDSFTMKNVEVKYTFEDLGINEDKGNGVITLLGDIKYLNISNCTITGYNSGRGIIAKDGTIDGFILQDSFIYSGSFKDTNKYLGTVHFFSNVKVADVVRNNLHGSIYFNRESSNINIYDNIIGTKESSAISFGTKVSDQISITKNEIIGATNGIKFNGPETPGESQSTDFIDLKEMDIIMNRIMYSKSLMYIQGESPIKLEEKKDVISIKYNDLLNDENSVPFIIDSKVEFSLDKTNKLYYEKEESEEVAEGNS